MEDEREPEQGPEPGPKPGKRRLKPLLFLGILLGAGILLIGWNRVASSPRLCGSCHAMDGSVVSAARSVHSDVPCLACHSRPGLIGTLRYIPTLAREGIATTTGWHAARGVLTARSCFACHFDLNTNPSQKATHAGATECVSCHGDVSHPPLVTTAQGATPAPSTLPHPADWTQTHGQAVSQDPNSCLTCHRTNFCETCHFKEKFPHPPGWISKHGPVQEKQGAAICTTCHPTTFCAGCHGTEIPHQTGWLDEHRLALASGESVSPCLLCHPTNDCTTCHARHAIHRDQSLYAKKPT